MLSQARSLRYPPAYLYSLSATGTSYKTKENFERLMTQAMSEARRLAKPESVSVVVFAHQTTAGWEAMLSSLITAGWIVTASWPIDTEMPTRVRAMNSAVLASSIHLACRPREDRNGQLIDSVGDWRDVLNELPQRIHQWMPRLAEEGVVGADAIFSCLGPSLEIYSRYSSVQRANGEKISLKEYLKEVWAAVAKEALTMIFKGADASGFEEDARLTAMWLWTLKTGSQETPGGEEEGTDDETEDGSTAKDKNLTGYSLEFDAARKIAQGLGAHLDALPHLVQVKGDTATLLSVGARAKHLFGKDAEAGTPKGRPKKKPQQMTLDFKAEIEDAEARGEDWAGELAGKPGSTILDQVHQSMILFAANRTDALRRFIVEEGVGRNPLFWRLAQALSALYPSDTEEKRWVDGVMAKKKGFGF